jgi:hypothetical protein
MILPIKTTSMQDNLIKCYELGQVTKSIDSLRYQLKETTNTFKSVIEKSQSKECFVKGVSNDTVYTVSVTLFIFLLGILINEIIKRIEKYIEKRKIRKYFKYHVDKIYNSFTLKLIKAYKDYYQNISVDTGISRTPPKILSYDFERIRNIDSKELFHSIQKKTELSKILSQLDYFDKILKEVDDYHKNALLASDTLREKLGNQINNYLNLLAEFVDYERTNDPSGYSTNPHFIHFNESLVLFYNQLAGRRALKLFYKMILRPNQKYLVNEQLFRTHEKGKSLTELGKETSYTYNDLRRLTMDVRLQFREFVKYIEESRNVLKENIDKVNWG